MQCTIFCRGGEKSKLNLTSSSTVCVVAHPGPMSLCHFNMYMIIYYVMGQIEQPPKLQFSELK